MKKWALAILALALVVAGGLAYVAANLDAYLAAQRDWLAAQTEAVFGRRVAFDGLEASFRGGLGVTIENLRIGDDPAYSEGDLLQARTVIVHVKVLPALFGRYEIRRVSVAAPRLTIVRGRDGTNLDTLGRPSPRDGAPSAGGGDEPAASLPAFLVALLDVRDGELRLVDRTVDPPATTVVRRLDVAASDLNLTGPLQVRATAAILGSAEPNVEVQGTIGPVGNPPAPLAAPVDMRGRLAALDLDALRRDVPAVAAYLPAGIAVGGTLTVEGHAAGTAERTEIDGTIDATAAMLDATTVVKPAGVPLLAVVRGTRAGTTIELARLTLRVAELELTGAGSVAVDTPPRVTLVLDGAPTTLAGWERLVPALAGATLGGTFATHLELKGPAVSGTITLAGVAAKMAAPPLDLRDLSGTLTLRPDSAELPATRLTLGGAPVEVTLRVDAFAAPVARVTVKAAEISAGALGVAGEGVRTREVMRGLTLQAEARLPADGPVVTGTVASSGGSLRDLTYDHLQATLGYQGGIATVSDLTVRAYGGTCTGRVRADVRDAAMPRVDGTTTVRGMAVEQLAATRFPAAAHALTGTLEANVTFAAAGATWETVQRTLRADGTAEVRDGVLHDVNLADQVLGSATSLPGLSTLVPPRVLDRYPAVFGTGDTRFDRLAGTLAVRDAVAHVTDAVVAARDYTIRGTGTVTLAGAVDFAGTLTTSEALTRDLTAGVREARLLEDSQGRLSIPFRVTGTPPKLRAQPDAAAVAGLLQRGLIQQGVDALVGGKKDGKKKGSPPPGAEDLLRKGLEGLLRR